MKSDEYLWDNLIMPILRQMYNEAEPSTNLDKLIENGEAKVPGFFEKYYLAQDRQDEILTEHINKFKLTVSEKNKVTSTITLGAAPNGVK